MKRKLILAGIFAALIVGVVLVIIFTQQPAEQTAARSSISVGPDGKPILPPRPESRAHMSVTWKIPRTNAPVAPAK
jgi:hypothetical protein